MIATAHPLIERTHHGQSELNLALLNAVAQGGTAQYGMLFLMFGPVTLPDPEAHAQFQRRLDYLCSTGQLVSAGRGRLRVLTLGPQAAQAPSSEDIPAATTVDQTATPSEALPPAYNAMKAKAYMPPTHPPSLRPGALDYRRYASRGVRC